MTSRATTMAILGLLAGAVLCAQAQTSANERSFPQSKSAVEKALAGMRGNLAGHLPVLDGFASPVEHPLEHYSRGFYQATAQVESSPSGSVVRINVKVTAWYSDPSGTQSGYKLLLSNGRLESDLLDQLAEQVAKSAPPAESSAPKIAAAAHPSEPRAPEPPAPQPRALQPRAPATRADAKPLISAPAPAFPENPRTFSSSVTEGLAAHAGTPATTDSNSALEAEAASLEEALKNQAHPKNLVAVKKSGTPVVAKPSLTAKPEFMASEHDEFEMLNFNADWVHVRISGLSRGWIWRNSVEMPEGIPDTAAAPTPALAPAADLFRVVREETAPFPGDWEPLRGKNVKIFSVQKTDDTKAAGAKDRLEFVKFLLEKNYSDLAQKSQDLAGLVVIFDSADGGMIATTLPILQQWKAGTLSDSALWHKCFFDPPETFDSAGPAGSS
jgi:hypothetical protein